MEQLMASQRSADGSGGLESLPCWGFVPTMMTVQSAQLQTLRFSKQSQKRSGNGRPVISHFLRRGSQALETVSLARSCFLLPLPLTMDGVERRREMSDCVVAVPTWIGSKNKNCTNHSERLKPKSVHSALTHLPVSR